MIEESLTQIVSDMLPGGRIEATVLPQCNDISLYLLNPKCTEGKLSGEQSRHLLEEPMYWMFCWASGQAMACYVLHHPKLIAGKQVLDFGCGSGVAAIAAAKAGAARVWACDCDPWARRATALNCQLNAVSIEVIKDWKTCAAHLDMILVADVLYDSRNLSLLDQFIAQVPEVLVADSRVKQLEVPFYRKISQIDSFTVPDLNEPAEFGRVGVYYAKR